MEWGYPALGLVVGLIVGMTGMGGGAIMTASLIGVFGVPPMTAVGTDLLYAGATKIVGTTVHHKNGNVSWRVMGLMALGSLPATVLVLWGLSSIGVENPALARGVQVLIGVAVVLAALAMVLQRQLKYARIKTSHVHWPGRGLPRGVAFKTVALGLVLGALVTISSVGAGAIGVAILFALYPRMTAARIVGTDIAHAVPLTLIAGLGHAAIGSVDWTLFGMLLVGSLPGIYIGSQIAHTIPERLLTAVLAIVLTVIGVRLLMGAAH